ncbi:hypothetical protein [Nonomuraea rhizosphaerae]|uniref:hypothetical protein n=1 Tax=Nonomuraea rhizosphaerae TaxID=2665663 RepID=UPI001C5EC311|nr:hypothetical protein [Nonomuraea rhizosphaerae]
MARTRATAVSALVLALGLTGVGVAPFVIQSASASSAFDPNVDPCEAGQVCDTTPETTVTITTTLDTPSPDPETTITKTVTAPTKTTTKTATPKKSKSPTQAAEPTKSSPPLNPMPSPTQSTQVDVPAVSPSSTPEDTGVVLPSVAAPTETPATSPSLTSAESPTEESIPLELRNAAPEYDQRTLTQKLSIPALIMVLLALFAVLIFEGRLRRMAHAAAVRKAGPPGAMGMGVPPGYPGGPSGYPAGPGYAGGYPPPGYPAGAAYAPIISFVPVQTYPSGQVQYGAVYQDPGMYGQPPTPPNQPVVLPPDQFDSYSHQPTTPEFDAFSRPEPQGEAYRAPFEPLVAPEQPPADIPPGGSSPYEDTPERPLGTASYAEAGDAEPWQTTPWPEQAHEGGPPARDAAPSADQGAADVTAVQPLPDLQQGGPKRRWGRRS